MRHLAVIVATLFLLWVLCGCGGLPGGRESAEVTAETSGPESVEAGGDVDARTESETTSAAGSSATAETARDVSTTRFGLDPGTQAVIAEVLGKALGVVDVLPKIAAAAVFCVIGFTVILCCVKVQTGIGFFVGVGIAVGGTLLAFALG